MSKLSEQILSLNGRELENGDWGIVHCALVEARIKFVKFGAGRQSWLDEPIAIAKERAKQNTKPDSWRITNLSYCGTHTIQKDIADFWSARKEAYPVFSYENT